MGRWCCTVLTVGCSAAVLPVDTPWDSGVVRSSKLAAVSLPHSLSTSPLTFQAVYGGDQEAVAFCNLRNCHRSLLVWGPTEEVAAAKDWAHTRLLRVAFWFL